MSAATAHNELVQLLEAVQAATSAISGQPDSPAVATWLEHRAGAYRRIAAEHPHDCEMPAEMARAAADLDAAHAERIRRNQ